MAYFWYAWLHTWHKVLLFALCLLLLSATVVVYLEPYLLTALHLPAKAARIITSSTQIMLYFLFYAFLASSFWRGIKGSLGEILEKYICFGILWVALTFGLNMLVDPVYAWLTRQEVLGMFLSPEWIGLLISLIQIIISEIFIFSFLVAVTNETDYLSGLQIAFKRRKADFLFYIVMIILMSLGLDGLLSLLKKFKIAIIENTLSGFFYAVGLHITILIMLLGIPTYFGMALVRQKRMTED